MGALVALLREDAILQMPPLPVWISGARAIGASIAAMVFTPGKSFRLVPTRANGRPAFLVFDGDQPMAIHVLDVRDGKIAGITAFIAPQLFSEFQPSP